MARRRKHKSWYAREDYSPEKSLESDRARRAARIAAIYEKDKLRKRK